jgi:pSer/pThr/pTyr-binding forkhead associated (FHA) protein
MVYKPKPPETEAVSAEELGLEREIATLSWEGQNHEIAKRRVVIGRSKDCDIQLSDPNVSRRHAEVRQEGAAYWAVDLDSTNGMEVNGKRLKRAKLRPGDTITVGSTELVFRLEAGG